MEQRLAEFRAARRRAGLAAEPSTWSQSAQTAGEKAEAAATPKAAPGWLTRFLVWKPRPASTRAQPSLAQEVAQPGSSTSQPPRNTAIPLSSPQDQSLLTSITFLKVLLWEYKQQEQQAEGEGEADSLLSRDHNGELDPKTLGSPPELKADA
ncbi:SAYSvFN domain-containing protein 1 isoform X2 [Vulpes lagopus]|uniref:SAYSvFN domain-containing protein 1 isoform X2 n=1 Tax=Vulpes lagopus TaxID=494514 RepID=UPI001BCA1626|nr:SAYSvFN domain-containing protein 1 isoform X2 [Vulpes lagopus]